MQTDPNALVFVNVPNHKASLFRERGELNDRQDGACDPAGELECIGLPLTVRDTEAGRRGLPDPSGGAVFGRQTLDGDDNTFSVYRRADQEHEDSADVISAFQGLREGRRVPGDVAAVPEEDPVYLPGGIDFRSSAEDDAAERKEL